LEACAAAGFVGFGAADEDRGVGSDHALGVDRLAAADRASCGEFEDLVRLTKKGWEGLERQPAMIALDAGDDDARPPGDELADGVEERFAEEVGFVDSHQEAIVGDLGRERVNETGGVEERDGGEGVARVGAEAVATGARVSLRLESDEVERTPDGGADSAEEFRGLPGEHRAADDFETTRHGRAPRWEREKRSGTGHRGLRYD
jgi:hypothetical protein